METAYESLSDVYDLFMDNVDYPAWCAYLKRLLADRGARDGLVLDLGCGTGTMTELLAKSGYDMIGVDASAEMLQKAEEKKLAAGSGSLYLLQDMRAFELYGTVRAVVSCCDCMNYLLTEEEILQTLRLVNNYLDPDGVLIFDVNTRHKYETIPPVVAENRAEGSFIWENDFDAKTGVNEYLLTLYLRTRGGLYERREEEHLQRAYPLAVWKELIEKSGLRFEAAYEAFTTNGADEENDRVCFIARERGKNHE